VALSMESGSPAGKGPRRAAKAPTMSTLHRCLRPTGFDDGPAGRGSRRCCRCTARGSAPWPRHGVDQIRHLVSWPACASITVEPVRGAWPHAEQDALIDCEMLGPWVTYARFKSPQALTEPRSLSTAWKHISSRRYVAHCTEYASTESSGSRTYRAASPVRATSGPRDASRGATPPRSIRRYPTTSALLGSRRLPPWTRSEAASHMESGSDRTHFADPFPRHVL
jgi:hypothetical protein